MKSKADPEIQYGVRVSKSTLDRTDKLAERMSQPGLRVKRADVLRLALFRGLDQLETETKR